jgi:hypothetical protein
VVFSEGTTMRRNYTNVFTLDGEIENIIQLILHFGPSVCFKQLGFKEVTYYIGTYPLNAFELGEVLFVLIKRGYFEDDISVKLGIMGRRQIQNVLFLRSAPEEIKNMIYKNWISWTLAIKVLKNQLEVW